MSRSNKISQYKIRCSIWCQVYSQFIGIIRCLQSYASRAGKNTWV